MFLKKWLSNFLFSSHCERCYHPLGSEKIFCNPCQAELYHHLSKSNILAQHKGYIECLLSQDTSFFDILFRLYQNPRYPFLSKGIASLIVLKLNHLKELPWPNFVVSTPFLKESALNKAFFKELAQLMQLPLISLKELDHQKCKGFTYFIMGYVDPIGLNSETFKESYLIHFRYLAKESKSTFFS